jgi:hypothetical protein
MRAIDILTLGADLRREAEGQCVSVNEAHFAVHEVLAEALACNPILLRGATLYGELSSRVRLRLIENSITRCGSVSYSWATLERMRH